MEKYLRPPQGREQNYERYLRENKKYEIEEPREPSSQFSPIDQIKVCTPTWRKNSSPQNHETESMCSSGYQSNTYQR